MAHYQFTPVIVLVVLFTYLSTALLNLLEKTWGVSAVFRPHVLIYPIMYTSRVILSVGVSTAVACTIFYTNYLRSGSASDPFINISFFQFCIIQQVL